MAIESIEMTAYRSVDTDSKSYAEILAKATTELGLDENGTNAVCGPLSATGVSPYPFIAINESIERVLLTPTDIDDVDTFDDAYLSVLLQDFPELGFEVPISATVKECIVEKLSFEKPVITLAYNIGSGPEENKLPGLTQKPNCGLTFLKVSIAQISSSLAQEQVAAAFVLDSDQASLTIDTDDYTLNGTTVTVKIKVDDVD